MTRPPRRGIDKSWTKQRKGIGTDSLTTMRDLMPRRTLTSMRDYDAMKDFEWAARDFDLDEGFLVTAARPQ